MEITRAYDIAVERKSAVFLGSKGLEKGCPCGLSGGKAVLISEKHEGFLGFVESGLDDGRCLVTIRGGCQLKIKDIHLAKIGDTIFCNGVNDFTLTEGSPIGVFKYQQPDFPGFGMVCFKRFDDQEQIELGK